MADPVSRRRFLTGGAVAAGAAAVGGSALLAGCSDDGGTKAATTVDTQGKAAAIPFYGKHQAGIATAQQDRLLFAAFDLSSDAKDDLVSLLKDWTVASERLTRGALAEPDAGSVVAPNSDTGEALGLPPSRLTITIGLGTSLFELPEEEGPPAGGREPYGPPRKRDRFGLAQDRPAAFIDLPRFPGDNLDPLRSGGDLCVQACADDPQVAYHAVRNLARIGRGRVTMRWVQQGFGRTSSTTTSQETPRNLMGFKDGTNNPLIDDERFDDLVWAKGPGWMAGGSYLVVRRIRMFIEVWDRNSLDDQQLTFGRTREVGAPLGGTKEHEKIDLEAKRDDGQHVIPLDAHVRLANQDATGHHILRRGYSFTDGVDPRTGQLDAGLFFLAYQADSSKGFIPLQQALAGHDALNEYIQHVGSAHFAVPHGVSGPGRFLADDLL